MNEQEPMLMADDESSFAATRFVPAAGVDYDWAVEQFYPALYKFAFGLAGSESDAADLTQDTYRVLLTKGDAIRDARKVKSWLFTTLYRQFLGRRRHATRFPETPVESAEWELPTITPQHTEALDGSLVVAALQQLEEKYRAPLTMFYLEELSYKEMAEVLGLPIGTIMSRLSRGKEILRKRLERPSAIAINCRQVGSPTRWQGSLVATVA
ncbi:MAG: RNA polymerase sigma factor [Chloroflexi bacterium]|nr:RNA polymerase sigma factor [Chloroflexota bacterium]